jgi:transposase-like protein
MEKKEISNTRIMRGLTITAQADHVKKINSRTWRVKSQSGTGSYLVVKDGSEWRCECPDNKFRGVECKHIHAIQLNMSLMDSKEIYETYELMQESSRCPFCGSYEIVKNGTRYNRNGKNQTYKCKECRKRFSIDEGFSKMKNTPEIITLALDLYMKGLSLRKVTDHLEQFLATKVHYATVLRWIDKYTKLINAYVEDFKPELSNVWHTDEMMIKTGGKWSWLWNCMDKDTRFLLANLITKTRETKDARRIFQEAKKTAGSKPAMMVTDGLRAYEDAFRKEFFTLKNPRTKHMRMPRFVDRTNNNIVERLHGTIRERDKVMRGMKGEETAKVLMDGLKNYYNFLRPNMGIENVTPAEKANINLELGRNRWKSIIRKSMIKKGIEGKQP